MKDDDFEIVDSIAPNDPAWFEWKALVEDEGWTSDDLSVLTLTPSLPSTRIVLARKRNDKSFIGTVIWNEYDDIAFIGFYLLLPEYRGKGLGSIIWNRAIDRMPRHYTIALRAVPNMVARYKSKDTPVEGPRLHSYEMDLDTLSHVAELHASKSREAKMVSDLSKAEYEQLEQFCNSVVKRDRRHFLRQFHELPFTKASVLIDNDRNIIAYAAVCPTSHSHSHLFKLAPLYASSTDEAFAVIQPLIKRVGALYSDARFIFHVLEGSIGFKVLPPIFSMKQFEFEILDKVPPDDILWKDFKEAVRAEGWINGADDSVLSTIPKLAKVVFARSKIDGNYIGSVIWCENDGLAYIAFYIIRPEYRGLGIGSVLWKRALERIPSNYTMGLRSDGIPVYKNVLVEQMLSRYKSMDMPVEGRHTFYQKIPVTDFVGITNAHRIPESTTKLVSELKEKEFEAMLSYANEVSGRDRSQLLRLHFDLDFTEGAVLTDSTAKIRGFASMTSTGDPDHHFYKISPVYAEGLDEALSVLHPLLVKILEKDPDAIALISTWSDSAGEQLRPLLQQKCIESKVSGYTLFSKPYAITMDFSRMFVGQNHPGHFDA
ncbi:hypothetical protein GCK32_004051 [Trichostrongylus colubriformis]|uniref:N-acetyltransferase domain-containing protein n=1 Tax=Trichostrongylus colubriformis TaxID=6319 RepID=A0AAN8FMW9_TRICO